MNLIKELFGALRNTGTHVRGLIGLFFESTSMPLPSVNKASQTLRNIDWFEVSQIRGAVDNGKPEFEVGVRIGFRLEGAPVDWQLI